MSLQRRHLLFDQSPDDLFQHRRRPFLPHRPLEVTHYALLDEFPYNVDLDVDAVPGLLLGHDHPFLGVGDQHDLEPTLTVVHPGYGQTGAVESDVTLFHNVPQHALLPRTQSEGQGVPVGRHRRHRGHRVDVTLDKVPSHPRGRGDGPLEVHGTPRGEVPQVRPPECLGGHADLEALSVELGDGQAGAVDAYGVAQGRVGEDGGAVGDGQGGAVAARGRRVECRQGRDGPDRLY